MLNSKCSGLNLTVRELLIEISEASAYFFVQVPNFFFGKVRSSMSKNTQHSSFCENRVLNKLTCIAVSALLLHKHVKYNEM